MILQAVADSILQQMKADLPGKIFGTLYDRNKLVHSFDVDLMDLGITKDPILTQEVMDSILEAGKSFAQKITADQLTIIFRQVQLPGTESAVSVDAGSNLSVRVMRVYDIRDDKIKLRASLTGQ